MLAGLANIPSDPETWNVFSFANQDSHLRIIDAIQTQKKQTLQQYILDPLPLDQFPFWLQVHQQAHNIQNQVLGIAGNDLTAIDFTKPDEIASWIWLHFSEHRQAENELGIG